MNKRIVVTGLGALVSEGASVEEIGVRLRRGDRGGDAAGALRQAPPVDWSRYVAKRVAKKLDRFCLYGMCAAGTALDDSGVLASKPPLERVGIFVGNCLGGWGFTEPELRSLHTKGVRGMSPFVSTAWFPAALQGQLSLVHDIKGYSKTFSAAGVAGMQALGYGFEALRDGRADVVLCGASEDLSSGYLRAIISQYQVGGERRSAVFGAERHDGFGQGAAFLVLEERDAALHRGAHVYCEITGFADGFCPSDAVAPAVVTHNTASVLQATNGPALLVADGAFRGEAPLAREAALRLERQIDVVTTRPALGNMFSVSGVAEAVYAARELKGGAVTLDAFGAGAGNDTRYRNVIVRRLSATGNVSSIALSADAP